MKYKRITVRAHEIVADCLQEGDRAIDATAGNGHDTLFLARCVGSAGHVYAFDVQAAALANTGERLKREGLRGRVSLIQETHANMAGHEIGPVAAVMFNLGYLPGGDHTIITETAETLRALDAARSLLQKDGVLTILCYPGHPGGKKEADAVTEWAKTQNAEHFPSSDKIGAPFLLVIRA